MKKIKLELVRYGNKLYAEGLVIGTGGNISARQGNKIYIKASRTSLKNSKASDYNEINMATGKAACRRKPCSIEAGMHLACYAARSDIGAVIHVHPIYGTIAGMKGVKLGHISYEFMTALRSEVPTIDYKKAGSRALAESVKKAIKDHNAVLLKNHGSLVVGEDLEEAYVRTIALERACKIYILSKLGNKVSFLPKAELRRLSRY